MDITNFEVGWINKKSWIGIYSLYESGRMPSDNTKAVDMVMSI
jgi:hypothetical protein